MISLDAFEQQHKLLVDFKNHRELFRQEKDVDNYFPSDKLIYLHNLVQMPISNLSKFGSSIWDFNSEADAGNVSINCRGSALKITWNEYHAIPSLVITEIKCITFLYKLSPKLFINKDKNGKHVKSNTLVSVTKYGLAFINHLFELLNDMYGKEYVQSTYFSFLKLNHGMFEKASSTFNNAYCPDLKVFLDNLRHPYTKNIVGDIVTFKSPSTLTWKKTVKKGSKKFKVIPDSIFEKLVYSSSLLIADFLNIMEATPSDVVAIKFLKTKSESLRVFSDYGFTKKIFESYAASRLVNAGYDSGFVMSIFPGLKQGNNFNGANKNLISSSVTRNSRLREITGNDFKDVMKITSIIKYSAQYLIAQFTGMRPSELALIPIDCITEESNIKLIRSKVTKGRKTTLNQLFDDKWVVIPAIEDAIKALQILNQIYQSENLFSNVLTKPNGKNQKYLTSGSFSGQIDSLVEYIFDDETKSNLGFYTYMTRHTLAYQLFRADLGLPFISYQLKHLIQDIEKYTSNGMHSSVTLTYGQIGDKLASGTRGLRKQAEIERVKSTMDPDGVYLGPKGQEHKENLVSIFKGYIAEGYDKEQVFEAMVEQGFALINMGTGFCYGGESEDFDESIPCIGTLRCNPIRCKNAVVTKANAPKWREVYFENTLNLSKPEYVDSRNQIQEAINEAKNVLAYLGESIT